MNDNTVLATPGRRSRHAGLNAVFGVVLLVALLGTAEFIALRRQRNERVALRAAAVVHQDEIRAAKTRAQGAAARLETTRVELRRLADLARSNAELDTEVETWLARAARLREAAANRPDLTLPEVALLNDDDWFDLARDAELGTEEQLGVAFQNVRRLARSRAGLIVRRALMRYADAHHGLLPVDVQELGPLCTPPLPPGVLDRYRVNGQGLLPAQPKDAWLIIEHGALADRDSTRLAIKRMGYAVEGYEVIPAQDFRAAITAYAKNHGGQDPATPAALMPYFRLPPYPAAAKALLEKSPADFAADITKAKSDE